MDRFNDFAWGSISFEQLHDSLSFAASRRGRDRVEGDGEGDEEMRVVKEEGWNEFTMTVDWASPLHVYAKMVGLVQELAMEEPEDVNGLDDDNEVVIILDGHHVGTKKKFLRTTAMSNSMWMRLRYMYNPFKTIYKIVVPR
ncbi:DDRGK domain-containing protein 1-like [Pyrus ussuriensis x Pyrus communis]|uniref:DDRGK domain-containing protein 1-like n=1 Tax=Pyrus ussuriensis x Pyrus communis TaxID=2448454 RepID=A0A5N5FUH9_9ROSA|nr:DDRGK domain-containing protein 1-like [Pyrus ussuriensis x Pyrus communis]